MPNDSKLGLLAGVAGVVVAAVMLGQPASPPGPAENAKSVPVPAATPAIAKPASTPVASRNRPEVEGKTASRPARSDDDE